MNLYASPFFGAAIILFVLWDMFHVVFHPGGRGALADSISRWVWKLAKALPGRSDAALSIAGPIAVVTIVTTWTVLLLLGWTLVYWPFLTSSFVFATGLDPSKQGSFADALYFAGVTMMTLGYGDVVPTTHALRLLVPLMAGIGFTLLTVSMTWVVSLYPVLQRRRTLAHQLFLLATTSGERVRLPNDTSICVSLLSTLQIQLLTTHADLKQFSVSYYFHDKELPTSLPHTLAAASELAELANHAANEDIRAAGRQLERAIEELLTRIQDEYLPRQESATPSLLQAYAADHRTSLIYNP